VLALGNLRLFLNMVLEFCIISLVKEPLKDSFLNFLVVLLFEKVIVEKFHGGHHENLSFSSTRVEGANRSVGWETDWSTRHDGNSGSVDIKSGAIGVDELKSTISITVDELFGVLCIALGVLASLRSCLFNLSFSNAD